MRFSLYKAADVRAGGFGLSVSVATVTVPNAPTSGRTATPGAKSTTPAGRRP